MADKACAVAERRKAFEAINDGRVESNDGINNDLKLSTIVAYSTSLTKGDSPQDSLPLVLE